MMIVTTDHAGIPDIVKDGVNGIVVDKHNIDTQRIYSKILKADIQIFGRKNRQEAKKDYNQSEYIASMKMRFQNA